MTFSEGKNVDEFAAQDYSFRKYVHVPTAYAAFRYDIWPNQRTPIELARLGYNITQYNLFPDCGHFAALECPQELSADILNFANRIV